MKRLIVLTILVTIAISITGCRRRTRLWGLRGAPCAAPVAPTYTPVPCPTAPPAVYCPPVQAAPSYVCPDVSCGVGSYYGGGTVISDTVIGGNTHGGTPVYAAPADTAPVIQTPSVIQTTPLNGSATTTPLNLSDEGLISPPVYGHTVNDRKLQPGESLQREVRLPVAPQISGSQQN